MRNPFIAGNWKMYKNKKDALAFAEELKSIYSNSDIKVAICAPYTQLDTLVSAFKGTNIKVGAQNVHYESEGAYTGEVSLDMLKEIGIDYCIIGHSERRTYFNETDESINKKIKKIFLESDIVPILCVGENLKEREDGLQEIIVKNQLEKALTNINADEVKKLVVAYEPIWAIGTGITATPEEAEIMCKLIRDTLTMLYDDEISDLITIQYGGSVKPSNASDIMNMDEIDGALVGGASLNAQDFFEIIRF